MPLYFDLFLFAEDLHKEVHKYPTAARHAQKAINSVGVTNMTKN